MYANVTIDLTTPTCSITAHMIGAQARRPSVTLPVAKPWPSMQRYDFVVRTRELDEQEAHALRKLLPADGASPYHRAARAALTELSERGLDK